MSSRIGKGLVVAAVLLGTVGIAIFAYWNTVGYWPRLRAAADNFGVPEGLRLIKRQELGTSFCLVTCEPASITVVFESPSSVAKMCGQVANVARQKFHNGTIATLRKRPPVLNPPNGDLPLGLLGCVYAHLPEVGSGAYMSASAGCFGRVTNRCITVGFTSGLD